MEMFLVLVVVSFLGVVISAVLFAAATRDEQAPKVEAATSVVLPRPHFFADDLTTPNMQVPVEAILLQIERHVRLEQAAAESFVDLPSRERLHSRTASPLVH